MNTGEYCYRSDHY